MAGLGSRVASHKAGPLVTNRKGTLNWSRPRIHYCRNLGFIVRELNIPCISFRLSQAGRDVLYGHVWPSGLRHTSTAPRIRGHSPNGPLSVGHSEYRNRLSGLFWPFYRPNTVSFRYRRPPSARIDSSIRNAGVRFVTLDLFFFFFFFLYSFFLFFFFLFLFFFFFFPPACLEAGSAIKPANGVVFGGCLRRTRRPPRFRGASFRLSGHTSLQYFPKSRSSAVWAFPLPSSP